MKCKEKLRTELGGMLVSCIDGNKYRLDKTFLSSKELIVVAERDGGVPFLDVGEKDHEGWKVLKVLGVSITVDVGVYLRGLERCVSVGVGGEKVDELRVRVERLLDLIQGRCVYEGDVELVRYVDF